MLNDAFTRYLKENNIWSDAFMGMGIHAFDPSDEKRLRWLWEKTDRRVDFGTFRDLMLKWQKGAPLYRAGGGGVEDEPEWLRLMQSYTNPLGFQMPQHQNTGGIREMRQREGQQRPERTRNIDREMPLEREQRRRESEARQEALAEQQADRRAPEQNQLQRQLREHDARPATTSIQSGIDRAMTRHANGFVVGNDNTSRRRKDNGEVSVRAERET